MPLIAIDGLDGSGKHTQSQLLFEELSKTYHTHLIDFPRYENPSSTLVREHLSNRTSTDSRWENPYLVSSYYACDRAISYQTEEWKDWLAAGHVVISDRYITANMIYQTTKLPDGKRREFLHWLWDYETAKLRVPAPDLTLYLRLSWDMAVRLLDERSKKKQSPDRSLNGKKDVYESDKDFLRECYYTANQVADMPELGWNVVSCDDEINGIRPPEEIHGLIMDCIERNNILRNARRLDT